MKIRTLIRVCASREAIAVLGLTTALTASAVADVKYTEVMSIDQGGKLVPMTTSTTYLKDGLERVDTKQDLGMYKMEETAIRNAARKESMTLDYKLKLYTVSSLDAYGNPVTADAGKATPAGTGAKGTGKIIWTVDADFVGNEKLADYQTRHYKTTQTMDSSGCCGTSKTNFKTEVWMADVKLPVFNAGSGAEAWQRGLYGGKSDCVVSFERKGDIKTYEESTRGLAMKTIMFNDQTGKPMSQREITLLVFPTLADSDFAVPSGFKKVSKEEYQQARSKAMMAAMTAPTNDAQAEDDATEEPKASEAPKPVDGGDVAEDVAKETAKQKARKKFRLPF